MDVSPQVRLLIQNIRLLVFDFDGVFTDNGVWVLQDGTESVRCSRFDGLGLSRLRALGMQMMVLSTEENPIVSARCAKLKISCVHGVPDKGVRLAELAAAAGVDMAAVAYVGNDINDLGCLRLAGLPIVVADAHPDVRMLGLLRSTIHGGHGAVREICDLFSTIIESTR